MEREERTINPEDLPFDLTTLGDQFDDILHAEIECPGVYYIITAPKACQLVTPEYYAVTEDAQMISKDARRYGKTPPQIPGLLLFECGMDGSGWEIVRYEIGIYRTSHNIPLPSGESLHELAVFGMELYPEYFGELPVPAVTPLGYTARHKRIDNGVHWIETDQGRHVLAVAYPYRDELMRYTQGLGLQTERDLAKGLNRTRGYLFFPWEVSSIPIFELMQSRNWSSMINKAALMNAIWDKHPEYAVMYNTNEQAGLNDAIGYLLKRMGEEDLEPSEKHIISYTPGIGTEFWKM